VVSKTAIRSQAFGVMLTLNEETGILEPKKVLKTGVYENSDLVTIDFDNSSRCYRKRGTTGSVLSLGFFAYSPLKGRQRLFLNLGFE
jgi:hypothetical protein